jgi:hypothetical protein
MSNNEHSDHRPTSTSAAWNDSEWKESAVWIGVRVRTLLQIFQENVLERSKSQSSSTQNWLQKGRKITCLWLITLLYRQKPIKTSSKYHYGYSMVPLPTSVKYVTKPKWYFLLRKRVCSIKPDNYTGYLQALTSLHSTILVKQSEKHWNLVSSKVIMTMSIMPILCPHLAEHKISQAQKHLSSPDMVHSP